METRDSNAADLDEIYQLGRRNEKAASRQIEDSMADRKPDLHHHLLQEFGFRSTPEEQYMRDLWADINANWGRLELLLYFAVKPINLDSAADWTSEFLKTRHATKQIEKVRQALEALVGPDDPLNDQLSAALAAWQEAK